MNLGQSAPALILSTDAGAAIFSPWGGSKQVLRAARFNGLPNLPLRLGWARLCRKSLLSAPRDPDRSDSIASIVLEFLGTQKQVVADSSRYDTVTDNFMLFSWL